MPRVIPLGQGPGRWSPTGACKPKPAMSHEDSACGGHRGSGAARDRTCHGTSCRSHAADTPLDAAHVSGRPSPLFPQTPAHHPQSSLLSAWTPPGEHAQLRHHARPHQAPHEYPREAVLYQPASRIISTRNSLAVCWGMSRPSGSPDGNQEPGSERGRRGRSDGAGRSGKAWSAFPSLQLSIQHSGDRGHSWPGQVTLWGTVGSALLHPVSLKSHRLSHPQHLALDSVSVELHHCFGLNISVPPRVAALRGGAFQRP